MTADKEHIRFWQKEVDARLRAWKDTIDIGAIEEVEQAKQAYFNAKKVLENLKSRWIASKKVTGIIGAMDTEVAAIRAAMISAEECVISGIPFAFGILSSKPIILARCGIGKVNAAVCAQIMISVFDVNEIINTGVAGAVAHGIQQNDIVIAKNFVQYDVDTSPLGDRAGFVSTVNKIYFDADEGITSRLCAVVGNTPHVVEGTVATGDQFVADKAVTARLRERFGAVACDMEGGAIAHVCALAGVPFGAVRCISDSADENAAMDYPSFAAKAAETCASVVRAYVEDSLVNKLYEEELER